MARSIEELLLRHLRKRNPDDPRGQPSPGLPINADAARHYCSHLTDRSRAHVDPDAVAAVSSMVVEADGVVRTTYSHDRFHNIPTFSGYAFFKNLTGPRLAGAWITATAIKSVFEHLPRALSFTGDRNWTIGFVVRPLVEILSQRAFPLTTEQVLASIDNSVRAFRASPPNYVGPGATPFDYQSLGPAIRACGCLADHPLSPQDKDLLERLYQYLAGIGFTAEARTWAQALGRAIGIQEQDPMLSTEPFGQEINRCINEGDKERRDYSRRLIDYAVTVSVHSKPAKAWFKTAREIVDDNPDFARELIPAWLAAFAHDDRTIVIQNETYHDGDWEKWSKIQHRLARNTAAICGIAHMARMLDHPRALSSCADVIEHVARCKHAARTQSLPVAKAALASIENSTLPAAANLARLSLSVRWPTLKKAVEKSFEKYLAAHNLSRDDVEEAGVPDFGLKDGAVRIPIGESAHAELTLAGSETPKVTWHHADKSSPKLPPALKKSHPAECAAVKELATEIEKNLKTQRTRLDLLFRRQTDWPLDLWRERYLNHGLIGPMARRLIWLIDGQPLLHFTDHFEDIAGQPVAVKDSTRISLWHPALRPASEVGAWRRRLEILEITQPLKQAHREVYLLTDAERRTATYSNRFAGHIVKNQATLALSQVRKWKMGLYGGDSSPSLRLPHFNLRAEWWLESAGPDTDRLGFPLYFATDQVRFYFEGEPGPIAIDRVPPLAFTEIMRDVDLFVSLASVGNDPTWQDGGPGGRYREYWHNYSFGDLTETALTRKTVLQSLLPRLSKIRDRASLNDKFLVIRGDMRTYKIHLGSGNILMEPNDQYLCIVPDRSTFTHAADVFLPFEGDSTLAVILSKAFLLAEDKKITDPTITRQITTPVYS